MGNMTFHKPITDKKDKTTLNPIKFIPVAKGIALSHMGHKKMGHLNQMEVLLGSSSKSHSHDNAGCQIGPQLNTHMGPLHMAWASSQLDGCVPRTRSWKKVETHCLLKPHSESLQLHSTHQAIHKGCLDLREKEIDWWRAVARACGPENIAVDIFEKYNPSLIPIFPPKELPSGAFSHQTLL